MPTWFQIATGPIFYFALTIAVFGLLRLVILSVWGMADALRRAGNPDIAYGQIIKDTLSWFFPFTKMHRLRPVHSYASVLFHTGILLALFFLQNHIDILYTTLGLAWPAFPRLVVDIVTLLAIVAGGYILLYRLYSHSARSLSRGTDYLLLIILLGLFISGYVAGQRWNPIPYDGLMLFHTIGGILLLVLIPFTKVAHCALFPLIRLGSAIGWHLTPQGGTDVARTLYGPEGRKV